jgi:hypothetical protein
LCFTFAFVSYAPGSRKLYKDQCTVINSTLQEHSDSSKTEYRAYFNVYAHEADKYGACVITPDYSGWEQVKPNVEKELVKYQVNGTYKCIHTSKFHDYHVDDYDSQENLILFEESVAGIRAKFIFFLVLGIIFSSFIVIYTLAVIVLCILKCRTKRGYVELYE